MLSPADLTDRHAVLPEISTEGYTTSSEDINKLVKIARDLMLENLEELGSSRSEKR